LCEVSGTVVADGVVAEVQVGQDLVLYQQLGQATSSFIPDLVVRKVQVDYGGVQGQARSDEFEQLVVD